MHNRQSLFIIEILATGQVRCSDDYMFSVQTVWEVWEIPFLWGVGLGRDFSIISFSMPAQTIWTQLITAV